MSMAYTKLFSSIITSTIWMEPDQIRLVWITMLAVADKNGEVQGSVPGLARIAGVPIEAARDAISRFMSPDPDSRTKDDEGRRIEEIDGGWRLLNHRKYREMCSRDEAREAEAKRKAAYREKIARNGDKSGTVPDLSQQVPVSLHIAEAKADAEVEVVNPIPPSVAPFSAGERVVSNSPTAEQIYQAYPRKVGKAAALKAIAKAGRTIGFDQLFGFVKEYAAAIAWQDQQYIPHPASWMNAARWEDDREDWKPRKQSGHSQVAAYPVQPGMSPDDPILAARRAF